MKHFWGATLLFFCSLCATYGQYHFRGQVNEHFANRTIYLSLVDNYRKSSRVYLDQIIQKTQADSLGFFKFEGDFLSTENRIYRIHTDSCTVAEAEKNHFLKECFSTEQLLFIAHNQDTLSLPLGNQNQAFCEIVSTNPLSHKILEASELKENMIVDFLKSEGEAAKSLYLDKWFKKFQAFGQESSEPLIELYCYDFLSDRSSETQPYYLKNLSATKYYTELLSRLAKKYPDAPFTEQYQNELEADKMLAEKVHPTPYKLKGIKWLPIISILGLALILFIKYRKKNMRSLNQMEGLSPQEQKVYHAIRSGKTNKEIAAELFISLSTVKTHVNNIYKKLGVTSRQELQ